MTSGVASFPLLLESAQAHAGHSVPRLDSSSLRLITCALGATYRVGLSHLLLPAQQAHLAVNVGQSFLTCKGGCWHLFSSSCWPERRTPQTTGWTGWSAV